MYTVIGMDVDNDEFERLRSVLKDIEDGKVLGLKQGTLDIKGADGTVNIAISYLDKEIICKYCNGCPRRK